MVAGLWLVSAICMVVFGVLFRESYSLRRKHRKQRGKISRKELDRAEWLETIEGGFAILGVGLAIVAWILMVQ